MRIELFIGKKQRLFFVTIILFIIMIIAQLASGVSLDWRAVLTFTIATYILTFIGLGEDINGIEFLTLFILPVLFSAAVFLSYYLLPVRWLTRLIVDSLFAVLFYSCLLTENIFNVAVARTIQLARVARTVSLMLTIVSYFLICVVTFSFHLEFYINFIIIFTISFLLLLQSFWNVNLPERIGKREFLLSLGLGLLLCEATIILGFWPLGIYLTAIFLTGIFYATTVLITDYLQESIFSQQIKEFCILLTSLILLICLMGKWGGG